MSVARCLSAAALTVWAVTGWLEAEGAESIQATSTVSASSCKAQSILMVGTSAMHTDTVLGNKQAIIGAEVRKLLKAAGIPVTPVGMKAGEPDPAAFVAAALVKNPSSHVLRITIPSGTVRVKRSTGETVAAERYVVNAELAEAAQGAPVWVYSGEIEADFFLGASNAQVAESIVARARADGCF